MGRAREYVDIHYRCSLDTKMYIVNTCTSDVKTRLCWGSPSLRLAWVFILRALHDIHTLSLGLEEERKLSTWVIISSNVKENWRFIISLIAQRLIFRNRFLKPTQTPFPTHVSLSAICIYAYLLYLSNYFQSESTILDEIVSWVSIVQTAAVVDYSCGTNNTWTMVNTVDKHWGWNYIIGETQGLAQDVKTCAHN